MKLLVWIARLIILAFVVFLIVQGEKWMQEGKKTMAQGDAMMREGQSMYEGRYSEQS